MLTLKNLIDISAKTTKKSHDYEIDLSIEVDGETWRAYEASVSYRDILLFTDQGTVTLFVDTYGDKNTFQIFDYERDK